MAVIYSADRSYGGNNYQKWYSLLKPSDSNDESNNNLYDSLPTSSNASDSNNNSNDKPRYKTRSLLDDHPEEFITNELIAQIIIPFGSKSIINPRNYVIRESGERAFTLFRSHIEFTRFQLKLPADKRTFFEIALGGHIQKPHFDIDIDRKDNPDIDGDDVIDDLVDAILMILSLDDVEIMLDRDILLLTSHGESKWSYHLVIDHYYHLNNKEAKTFYEKVISVMSPDYAKFVDPAVYGSKQQFRIVYNQKPGTGRVKTLCEKWEYHGDIITYRYIDAPRDDNHKMLLQLEATLLTVTSNCIPMPTYIKAEDTQRLSNYSSDVFMPITKEIARSAVSLLAEQGGLTPRDPKFPYRFTGISESFVILKRRKASICRICNRVHEHENPYLLVVGEKKSVYFCCRRNPKKWFLGNLENGTVTDDTSSNSSPVTPEKTSQYSTSSNTPSNSTSLQTSNDTISNQPTSNQPTSNQPISNQLSNSISNQLSNQPISNQPTHQLISRTTIQIDKEIISIDTIRHDPPDISISGDIANEISQLAQSSETGRKPLSDGKRITVSTEVDYSNLNAPEPSDDISPCSRFQTDEKTTKRPIDTSSVKISSIMGNYFPK